MPARPAADPPPLPPIRAEVLRGDYAETGPDWTSDDFTPEFYRFKYVTEGRCRVRIGRETVYPARGRLFLFPDGDTQAYALAKGCRRARQYWIHFHATAGGGAPLLTLLRPPLSVPVSREDEPELLDGLGDLTDRLSRPRPLPDTLRLSADLLRLLAFFLERAGSRLRYDPPGMGDVLRHIERHLDAPLSVADLARVACLEPSYFSRKFQKSMGCPPSAYVRRIRLEKARALLEESDATVAAVAEACGYPDAFQFSRMFKKHLGIAPTEWRKVRSAHP